VCVLVGWYMKCMRREIKYHMRYSVKLGFLYVCVVCVCNFQSGQNDIYAVCGISGQKNAYSCSLKNLTPLQPICDEHLTRKASLVALNISRGRVNGTRCKNRTLGVLINCLSIKNKTTLEL
jgi:hypothetical protein